MQSIAGKAASSVVRPTRSHHNQEFKTTAISVQLLEEIALDRKSLREV